jgi:hypothetical protein
VILSVIAYVSFFVQRNRRSNLVDTPQFDHPRQGARVVMRVPVEIRGTSADGSPHEESTYTCVVGVTGAMIVTSRSLQVGSEMTVTNRFSQRTAKFRVAWVKQQENSQLWETGVESPIPLDDFWEVRFPRKPSH